MAAQCFKCHSPLDGDFGMIFCNQCGEINFFDENPGQTGRAAMPVSAEAAVDGVSSAPVGNENETKAISTPVGTISGVGEWKPVSSPPEAAPAPKPPPTPQESIQEIADFGNHPSSGTQAGPLFYDVQISGIDTLELRKALLEILRDSRFQWNVEELEGKIKNGTLMLPKLSPIKASVLVKKIRHLDIQVHWSQGNVYEAPLT